MKRLIPVIHLVNEEQVIKNVETCLSADINHVFIINHITEFTHLYEVATKVKKLYPNLWVGVNFLDVSPIHVLHLDLPFDAVWIDETLSLVDIENQSYKGEVFSGINFKYQKQFFGLALKHASDLVKQTSTVACTSGSGTGQEANVNKIKALKQLLGDFPLALASGVSSDNVESYLPYVDTFLVASSITDSNEMIRLESLKELKNKIYV